MTSELAKQIVIRVLNEQAVSVHPIVGKGSVNQIFIVKTHGPNLIVRMNDADGALHIYEKERWCMERAAAAGIPGPTVISIGKEDGAAYMIQSFVAGDNGEDTPADKRHIWRELGKYARIVHSIKIQGYGERLADPSKGMFKAPTHPGFDGSWTSFVSYNVDSLTEKDELIRLNVMNAAQSRYVRELFEQLLQYSFEFGLNHGDISLKNTIVSSDGTVHLLDWGSAEVSTIPHGDIIQLWRCRIEANLPNDGQIDAFLDGYGISPQQYVQMKEQLYSLLLLNAFDKLRWAIERSAQRVPKYAEYAKKVLKLVLSQTERE